MASSPYSSYLEERARSSNLNDMNSMMQPSPVARRSPPHSPSYGAGGMGASAYGAGLSTSAMNASTEFNRSDYVRPLAGVSHTGGNKVVIGALKTLQDKIRRLESEKEQYAMTAAEEKRRRESTEHTLTVEKSIEQRKHLEVENSLEQAKRHLETELSAQAEKSAILEEELAVMRAEKARAEANRRRAEEEAERAKERARETQERLLNESYDYQQRVEALANSQAETTRTLTIVEQQTQRQLAELQAEIEAERRAREEAQRKERAAQNSLRETLNVNEDLVLKMTRSSPPRPVSRGSKKKNSKKPKKKKNSKKPGDAPWVPSASSGTTFSLPAKKAQVKDHLRSRRVEEERLAASEARQRAAARRRSLYGTSAAGTANYSAYGPNYDDGDEYDDDDAGDIGGETLQTMTAEIERVLSSLEDEREALLDQYDDKKSLIGSGYEESAALFRGIIDAINIKNDQIASLQRYHSVVVERLNYADRCVASLRQQAAALKPPPRPKKTKGRLNKHKELVQNINRLERSLREVS